MTRAIKAIPWEANLILPYLIEKNGAPSLGRGWLMISAPVSFLLLSVK